MDRRTIMRNLKEHIFGFKRLVFMADLYKERYGAKCLLYFIVNLSQFSVQLDP